MKKLPNSLPSKEWLKQMLLEPLGEQKARLLVICCCLFILAISQSLFLVMLGPFLQTLFSPEHIHSISASQVLPVYVVTYFPWLKEVSFPRELLATLVPALMFLAALLKGFASYGFQYNQQAASLWLAKRYRDKLFTDILRQPFLRIKEKSAGEWMSVLMNDVYFLQTRFSDIAMVFMRDSILIFSCLLVLLIVHPQLSILVGILSPPLLWALGCAGKRISGYAQKWQTDLAMLSGSFLGMRERYDFIKAQGGESREQSLFEAINTQYYRNIKKSLLIRSSFAPGLELCGFLIFCLSIFAIGFGWLGTDFAGTDLIQFFAALGLILRPLRNVGEQFTKYRETLGALRESIDIFSGAVENNLSLETTSSEGRFDAVTIEKTSFFLGLDKLYEWKQLQLEPNKLVAIVGPSGSGKTALIRHLSGLVVPYDWHANISWQWLASQSNLVSQNPFFFQATLRQNLLYGTSQDCELDMWKVLQQVGLLTDVENLPGGLDFFYNPMKSKISGGQLQRLVIARAMLRNKPLWLFDEATSAIDSQAEGGIISVLQDLKTQEGLSILFVTHRMQYLGMFDEVWFVNHGQILAKGSHEEMKQCSAYANFIKGF